MHFFASLIFYDLCVFLFALRIDVKYYLSGDFISNVNQAKMKCVIDIMALLRRRDFDQFKRITFI